MIKFFSFASRVHLGPDPLTPTLSKWLGCVAAVCFLYALVAYDLALTVEADGFIGMEQANWLVQQIGAVSIFLIWGLVAVMFLALFLRSFEAVFPSSIFVTAIQVDTDILSPFTGLELVPIGD